MRTKEESIQYEVRMPDGTFESVGAEQLDIGDVCRCKVPGSDDYALYPDPKTGKMTTLFTMSTQIQYRVHYGDQQRDMLKALLARSAEVPGSPSLFEVPAAPPVPAKTTRTRKK
jgi:hypothetical protein